MRICNKHLSAGFLMLFWHDLCPGSVYLEPLCYYTKISCSTLVWADPWGSVLLSRKTVCLQNPRMLSVSLLNYRKSTLYMLYLSVSLSNFHFSTLIHLYIFIYIFFPQSLVCHLFICLFISSCNGLVLDNCTCID
jgi:hypothetical protein